MQESTYTHATIMEGTKWNLSLIDKLFRENYPNFFMNDRNKSVFFSPLALTLKHSTERKIKSMRKKSYAEREREREQRKKGKGKIDDVVHNAN